MKKLLAVVLALCLCFNLARCGGGDSDASSGRESGGSGNMQNSAVSGDVGEGSAPEGRDTVTITLPAHLLERYTDGVRDFIETVNGDDTIEAHATANDDGSATMTMSKDTQTQLLSMIKYLSDSLLPDENLPEVTGIKFNDDMTDCRLTYDRSDWSGSTILGAMVAGAVAYFYHCFNGAPDTRVSIRCVDKDTGEEFASYTLHEDLHV